MQEDDREKLRRALSRLSGDAAEATSVATDVNRLRRARGEEEFRLVKREAKDVAHNIALGAVLVRRGLRHADSWKLDGLLSLTAAEFATRFGAAAAALPGKAAGTVLVRVIDEGGDPLCQIGRAAAWRRKMKEYWDEHRGWLQADRELREAGMWRGRRMSTGQAEVIRATCAILEADLPGNLLRGPAHDWIEKNGAIVRYRWRS